MEQQRRRIDQVMDPSFTEGLEDLDIDDIRSRRTMLDDLDTEFSYYRRILHGRMDLLDFELSRRAGTETRSLIEALPRILAEGAYTAAPGLASRKVPVELPDVDRQGRRIVDKALDGDFILRLPSLEDDELSETQRFLQEVEAQVSQQRRTVHDALDALQAELTRRYSDGSAEPDELPTSG